MQKNLELIRWSSLKILCRKIEEIDKFKDEYFTDQTKELFEKLSGSFLEGQPMNWPSLLASMEFEEPNNLDDNEDYLLRYLQILREDWERREIKETVTQVQFDKEIDTIKERLFNLVSSLDETTAAQELELFPGQRLDEIIKSTKERDISKGVFTGVQELDELLGGFDPGEFPLVAGRPSMGKSAFAVQIALENSFKRGNPTLLFSLEDTAENVILRCISHLTSVDFYKLKYNKLDEGDEYSIGRISKQFKETPLIILDQSQSVRNIVSLSRKLKAKYPAMNLIIVDYLQMITSSKEAYETASESSLALKNLAKDLKVVVLALSQLNRECERRDNHRPIKSDLRDSGTIEQDADRIIFPYRPGIYVPDDEAKQNICEYLVAKNRHGPIKNIIGECYMSCFQFN